MYIFIHIPKTAGLSLHILFRQVLGVDNVSPPIGVNVSQADIETLSRFRMLVGHFSFKQALLFPSRQKLTFLRDPVDMALSNYFFNRNVLTDRTEPYTELCQDLDLPDFLNSGDQAPGFFNGAVWQLSGSTWPSLSDDEALQLAKEHLASCEYVGIYEHMVESLDLLSYTFQWPQVDELPRENVTRKRVRVADLDRSMVARIRELSRLDAELYDYGLELFRRRRRQAWARLLPVSPGGVEPTLAVKEPKPSLNAAQMWAAVDIGRSGSGVGRILSVRVPAKLRSGDVEEIRIALLANRSLSNLCVQLEILNDFEQIVYGVRTNRSGEAFSIPSGQVHEVTFSIPFRLPPGRYRLDVQLLSGRIGLHDVVDSVRDSARFEIDGHRGPAFWGSVDLNAEITHAESVQPGELYELDEAIDFSAEGNSTKYRLLGWSPEPWACWTERREADLVLRFKQPVDRPLLLSASVYPFCPDPDSELRAWVIANGILINEWLLTRSEGPLEVEAMIPREVARDDFLHLVFRMDRPRVPSTLRISADPRALGLAFIRLRCSEAKADMPLAAPPAPTANERT